jgi:hypothetical protein
VPTSEVVLSALTSPLPGTPTPLVVVVAAVVLVTVVVVVVDVVAVAVSVTGVAAVAVAVVVALAVVVVVPPTGVASATSKAARCLSTKCWVSGSISFAHFMVCMIHMRFVRVLFGFKKLSIWELGDVGRGEIYPLNSLF